MKLSDILVNLERTITGKEEFLRTLDVRWRADAVIAEVLRINIIELNNIRDDIIKVMES